MPIALNLATTKERLILARAKRLGVKIEDLLKDSSTEQCFLMELNDTRMTSGDQLLGGEELILVAEAKAELAAKGRAAL